MRELAAALVAVLAGGVLAACATDTGAPPQAPQPCARTNPIPESVVQALAGIDSTEDLPVVLEQSSETGQQVLSVKAESATPKDVARTVAAVADEFGEDLRCGVLAAQVDSQQAAAIVRSFGLAEVQLAWSLGLGVAESHAFNTLSGVTAADLGPYAVDWALLTPKEALKSLTVAEWDSARFEALGAAAALFPALTSLTVGVQENADWSWTALAGFRSLTDLVVCVSACGGSGEPLAEVSRETMDIILAAPGELPQLRTVNGVDVSGGLEESDLVEGELSTRAEIKARREAAAAETALTEVLDKATDGGFAAGGSKTTITGPVVVRLDGDGGDNSVQAGVAGEDWTGIPAAKLCRDATACGSVVTVGFREGAASGEYLPDGGGAVAFKGKLGETIVTIYNLADKKAAGPVVVKTTTPPDTVTSKAEAVGAADYAAAYKWIASRTS
ncbi:MAG: hypothetical protein LBD97_03680 [Bifidobacteriaceae bacterium]|jgi:hypothetical protein|nr:hypothetical protein [Bifidobacteriaceae bacterium]